MVNWFKSPACLQRSAKEMQSLARETRGVSLYFHQLCPVCIRIRRVLRELNVPIELRDVRKSPIYCDDLLAGVGEIRTPCLRVVENGNIDWICGVEPILEYLMNRFGPQQDSKQRSSQAA